jgi:hypothetical protein
MRDRRKSAMFINSRGQYQKYERRIRLLERRKNKGLYRIIHIDVRNIWAFLGFLAESCG